MMEEVSDDTNGESSFEFIASSSFTPVNVTEAIQTSPSMPDKGIGDYFKDSSNIPSPSALPVFDIEPNISALPAGTPETTTVASAPTSKPPITFPPPVPSQFQSPSTVALPSSSNPLMSRPQPSQFMPSMMTQPTVVQSTQVMSSIPPPPQKSELPPPPTIASIPPHKRYPDASQTGKPIPSVGAPLPPLSAPAPGVYFQPNIASVPPCVPNTINQYQSPVSPMSVDFDSAGAQAAPENYHQQGNSGSLFGWIKDSVKGNEFLHKVAEKAKTSVDSVIYTLDPQMKSYMNSSPDSVVNIAVSSDSELKISVIRDAFQSVFVQSLVQGSVSQSSIASQPVGFASAVKGAEDRISNLRQRSSFPPHQVIVSVEDFLLESTPDNWYDISCLVLQDPKNNINLQTFTQATPVKTEFVMQVQDRTPSDYPLRWSGFAVPIGHVVGSALSVPFTEWHQAVAGVSQKEILCLAAKSLAGLYKTRLSALISSPALTM